MNNQYLSNKCISTLFFLIAVPMLTFAQNIQTEKGGEILMEKNSASNPCFTPQQYKLLEKNINDNISRLGINKAAQKNTSSTLFSWPLKMTNGLNDCSYYYIAAYLDEDTATGTIKDYNCGTNTYDTHQGNDIATVPYPFYKMDNNQIEVIAAAPGTIVSKVDGNFDKNCAGNNLTPNYIVVQHADGSCALYLHMKKNSLTAKTVGQTVVTGEFLGIVGSSGSSSAPHLHFEVWSGSTVSTLNDAFSGTCNTRNANSWWAAQKPYTEPAIIKAQVNTIAPVFPTCPTTETPNEDSCFTGGTSVKFYTFYRNETSGLAATMKILNPNGTTFSTWTHNSVSTYTNIAYYSIIRTLPNVAGTYTFESTYNGATCTKTFTVNCATTGITASKVSETEQLTIYPNPVTNILQVISSNLQLTQLQVIDILGNELIQATIQQGNATIDVSNLANGVYFIKTKQGTQKFMKE
ncbi:MAG: peptidoglycan DD-metalloendopeptidase family protein [Bacteroidia bacterium]